MEKEKEEDGYLIKVLKINLIIPKYYIILYLFNYFFGTFFVLKYKLNLLNNILF